MASDILIRRLRSTDASVLAAAFDALGWDKPEALFVDYARENDRGLRESFLAEVDGEVAGYCTLQWTSTYPPFRDAGIPEVSDLNVLPHRRNLGVGGALMDAVEGAARERSESVGLGVGLYADYGAAQRLYVRRGYVPDGHGVMVHYEPVEPGADMILDDDATLMMVRTFSSDTPFGG